MSTSTLPLVDGRHRNRALATARQTRAVELRAQGCTYQKIAQELGYANRGTVFRIVSNALASQERVAVDELRSLEAARLDALQIG
jgi:DNA-binding NarL/FixJ family response regulator